MNNKTFIFCLILLLFFVSIGFSKKGYADESQNSIENDEEITSNESVDQRVESAAEQADTDILNVRMVLELGFLSVLDHKIQFSKGNTYFDYVDQGGQDNLYFLPRLSIDFTFLTNHTIILLYQPLELETTSLLTEDFTIDNTTFDAGMSIRSTYSFPFYRLSYLYDFLDEKEAEVSIGLGIQIRNATIKFQSLSGPALDGTTTFISSNIGPVPLLKFRGRYMFDFGLFLGTEIDGFYAPVSYLNGSDEEVVGAILDASLFSGFQLKDTFEIFLNIRYIGGGAVGSSGADTPTGDGYTRNWLHFLTVTLGLAYLI